MIRAALLAALLAAPALAQKAGDPPVGAPLIQGQLPMAQTEFGGMDVYRDSAHLAPNEASTAVNVLTEHGYVEKRPGSVLATSVVSKAENIVGFVTQGGTWKLVVHSSDSLYATDLGAPPVAIATMTAGQPVSFQPAFNTLLAVDGFTEVEYDGVSTGTTVGFPECQFLEFAQQRVWCAKIRNESTSEVRISSVGSRGYWIVPPDPTVIPNAPNLFYINYQDGQPITCMKNTPWGVVVGKTRSLWIIKGYDNTNWYIQNVDPSIGCVDNRSMQMVDGRLQFGAVDGIYSWIGAGPLKLESLPIDPIYQSARQSTAQQQIWTTQQPQDWAAGVLTVSGPGAPMSASMDPGYLIPSSFTFVTSSTSGFAAGSSVNLSTSAYGLILSTAQLNFNWASRFNAGSEKLYLTSATVISSNQSDNFTTVVTTYTQSVGSFTFTTTFSLPSASAGGVFFMLDSNAVNTSGGFTGHGYALLSCPACAPTVFNGIVRYGGALNSQQVVKLAFRPPSATTTWTVYRSGSGVFNVSENGVPIGSFTDTTYSTPAYIGVEAAGSGANAGSATFGLTSYRYLASTGSYISPAYDTTLSTPTWGNFNATITSGTTVALGYSTITFQTQTSADGVTWSNLAVSTPSVQVPSPQQEYIRWTSSFTVISTGPASVLDVPTIQNVTILAATTGYYYSPVHFVGSDISSWATYDVGVTLPIASVLTGNALTGTSTITYQVRQATYVFSATAASPAWQDQQPNTQLVLTVSTPTYVQFSGYLNFSNAEIAPLWNLAAFNWNTGLPTSPAASAFLLHRYFLCVAIAGSNNDLCLVQQRTRDWVEFTGQSIGAYTLFNGSLYAGSGATDGSIWREMQEGVYNDAGSLIDSKWATGDMMFGDPVNRKAVDEIWLDALTSTNTVLNIGYAVDRSTTVTQKGIDLGRVGSIINLRVPIDTRYVLSKYFRLEFENTQNAYFRVNAFTIFGRYQPKTD